MRYDDYPWFPPSRPLPAKGGIRSRRAHGSFGDTWWARRWVETLEAFPIGSRLQRGRSYARKGQVLEIQVEVGEIRARVQGSRTAPYQVSVLLPPLLDEERTAVAEELVRQPRLTADLLAGEMPPEVEDAFAEAGVPLFPEEERDLETECTCPDWSNPCKHIAAVHYLVAEELDRNPFLLLRLRGFRRSDLVRAAEEEEEGEEEEGDGGVVVGEAVAEKVEGSEDSREGRPAKETGKPVSGEGRDIEASGGAEGHPAAGPEEGASAPGQTLPPDPGEFWEGPGEAEGTGPEGSAPEGGDEEGVVEGGPGEGVGGASVHLKTLGRIPFWRGAKVPAVILARMTAAAAPLGLEIVAGAEGGAGAEDGAGGEDGE